MGYKIDNVVIYLDTDYSFDGKGGCLTSDHYLVKKSGKYEYLKSHFMSFYHNMTFDKIRILSGLEISGEIFPNWNSDLTTNDPNHNCNNPSILLNYSKIDKSEKLMEKINSLRSTGSFFNRSLSQVYKDDQISAEEENSLIQIEKLFRKHATNYFVVITPLYDQLKFSKNDNEILTKIFGNRLFDFSGINEYTKNEYNYPDRIHFQSYVSKCIIDSIIKQERSKTCLWQ